MQWKGKGGRRGDIEMLWIRIRTLGNMFRTCEKCPHKIKCELKRSNNWPKPCKQIYELKSKVYYNLCFMVQDEYGEYSHK